ncbi:nucleotide-diphospho-sugar transferase [Lentinula aciculospora]|uniref:Nucleotide-diphospho-sugar transferase n=1 Tax=Lentinula aciculospora TaxID=153920 RepID=A0A9W9AQY3_9AGAR|nr:nucleotide-diphospho-sugar transferase [Lentinula aciculospora]
MHRMLVSSSRTRVFLFVAGLAVVLIVTFLSTDHFKTQSYRSSYASSPIDHGLDSNGDVIQGNSTNGAIFMLVSPSRIHQAIIALLNVENRFNRRLQYSYVLFTASEEESAMINEEERRKIDWITQGRAKLAVLNKESWDVPESYDKSRVNDSLHTIGFSSGYRSMCRFYSGFFWKHHALAQYDWLWRLDTDIEFHCDIPYDPIQRMIDGGALYGFVQINADAVWVQPSLAGNVSEFLFDYYNTHPSSSDSAVSIGNSGLPLAVPIDVNHGFVWHSKEGIEKALGGEAGSKEWTKMCMYNNFEISHRSIWESEIYTAFFKHLDRAGGFFYERWGDSPVHSFGIAMALRKDQVMQFRDMGYQHQGWAYECAQLDRCTCLRDEFDDQGYK